MGITQIKFLAFSIICKRRFTNSTLIGSPAEISKKIGISEHLTRTYLNYGLKNSLISSKGNVYVFKKYKDIIGHVDVIDGLKPYRFKKEGTFRELVEEILFTIAQVNFKRQKYNIDRYKKYLELLNQTEILIKKEAYLLKRLHKKYGAGKRFINKVITGQKHLSKILGVSQRIANSLLIKWHNEKRLIRVKVYEFLSTPDRFTHYAINERSYVLKMTGGYYRCKGSEIYE